MATTILLPKLALATVAAVGLYAPTLVLPLPDSCVRTIGVAGAAPSPSCSGDLRECLRASADLHQTTFGGRYVTADDVARCMEAFQSCVSGGASRGGNRVPPTSTSPVGDSSKGVLPRNFGMDVQGLISDCRVDGDALTCSVSSEEPTATGKFTQTGEVTGTLSGSTMKGTWKSQSRSDGLPGCVSEGQLSGPVSYSFNPDGTVMMRWGPLQQQFVYKGSCSGAPPYSGTAPARALTGTWSPK
jgi:hypothetical protein